MKTHEIPYLCRLLSAKEPCNWWLFCGKRPATKGILCIFATLYAFCPSIRQWMSYMQIWIRANLYPYISIRTRRTAVKGRFRAESFGCGSHTYIFSHANPCATPYPYVPLHKFTGLRLIVDVVPNRWAVHLMHAWVLLLYSNACKVSKGLFCKKRPMKETTFCKSDL